MSKRKESLVLLLNIGVTNPNIENNSSLFEKAKYIAQRKIEKMIFLKPKDEIAIMLMGSSITKNNLNSKYIEEFTDFQVPNWDFVRKCMNLKSTKYCYNWVEALYAAVEFIKQNVIDNSIRKIILMSDFNEETNIISKFEAKLIANKLFEEKIELITIAENLLHDKPLTSLNSSKKLLKDVHDQINGQHIIFDDAISCLKFYEQTSVKPLPSYYDLQLFDKKIPVVSYVKIDIEKFPTWKKAKGNQKLQSKIEYLDGQRNSYAKDEIIKGYKYGGTFIPVEKELEDKLSYKSEMKSYKIYGFTDKNNIDLEHFYKSATHVILPSSEESNVTKPFYSLVQAMHETNSVAIVRKVFRNNSTPRMVALFPCIDIPNEPWCLVEIELAFAEDQRLMESRPMKSIIKQLSNEQNKAVDNLINSLMLNDIQDSCEIDGNQYFLPGCVPNPAIQHRWHILSYRAINPDKPLPAMENYLKKILEAPLIKERKPAGSANPPQSQSTKRRCLAWINRCFCPCSTFISMGITYTCSVIALLAVLLVTTEAGDMMRKSIVFDKNTPDVFYCPQQKPTGFEKMLVTAKPLSRLCQFEGKPIPPDYKSDCYNDVDETEYACKEKYRIMMRLHPPGSETPYNGSRLSKFLAFDKDIYKKNQVKNND